MASLLYMQSTYHQMHGQEFNHNYSINSLHKYVYTINKHITVAVILELLKLIHKTVGLQILLRLLFQRSREIDSFFGK